MSTQASARVAGIYEHPVREAPDTSTPQLHADVAAGALRDAGLTFDDVDGYVTAESPGVLSLADYLGLEGLSYVDSTDIGGASYVAHVGHAAAAIAAGRCDVVLITHAGRPRSIDYDPGHPRRNHPADAPEAGFEDPYGLSFVGLYALAARRHMHEYGTTSEQLAEIRVAASQHAQHNEHAMFQDPVTVADVVDSPLVSDPLHLLDCCVVSDGGGAIVVASSDVASDLSRPCPAVLGSGDAIKHHGGGALDLTDTGAVESGPKAFDDAGVTTDDIDYASIYDSFTITVLEAIEDLGFCEKGEGGEFVEGGTLQAPDGDLPFNTDGGGLCSNHPGNRGGVTKVIEAVRQLRGEANAEVQVPDCEIALAHGTGNSIGTRTGAATLILGADR
ncbi:thiolase domain-containing protein [Natrinema caseinilyticum]|uniref:thiolase domain-containing protein n=1 Tax=Natrinema caseinilyticum TaxID=2961570 RepID=UPI0020C51070|nr:thiolase domain-containing protein [Natrinema caseinilyticum]